jgi:hypothetical protein
VKPSLGVLPTRMHMYTGSHRPYLTHERLLIHVSIPELFSLTLQLPEPAMLRAMLIRHHLVHTYAPPVLFSLPLPP